MTNMKHGASFPHPRPSPGSRGVKSPSPSGRRVGMREAGLGVTRICNPQKLACNRNLHHRAVGRNAQGFRQPCCPTRDSVGTAARSGLLAKTTKALRQAQDRLHATVGGAGAKPRLHLIRVHCVLAPNAKLRSKVVPAPTQQTTTGESDCEHAQSKPVRMTWARLLKRVFDIDIEQCACGGK